MRNRVDVNGKKALITGGGSGIGLATAEKLASKGALPILVDRNKVSLDKALSGLEAGGFEAHAFQLDVTDIEGARRLAGELEGRGLSPDILINCAGLTLIAHVSATDHEDWNRMIDVNLMGTIHMIETFLPAMLERGHGHIVNIGSIDGLIPIPGLAAYCASKFAVSGLTEVLYFDLKHRGVGVTMICPGYVNTPMTRAQPVKDLPIHFKGSRMVRRLLEVFSSTPQKIADCVVDAVTRGRFLVIPGFPSKVFYHYRRLFPRFATSSGAAVAKVFEWMRGRFQRGCPQCA